MPEGPLAAMQLSRTAADARKRCACSTATLSSPAGDVVVLRVAGEVDLTSFPVLDAALDDVLHRRPDHLVIDLTAMVFCSARGLTAIVRAAQAARRTGTTCDVSGASPMLVRLWPHFWSDGEAPRIHRTTAAAVLAAIRSQTARWDPAHPSHLAGPADRDPVRRPVRVHGVDGVDRGAEVDDADLLDRSADHRLADDAREGDPAALQQALHRHRSRMYRTALHALGVSYGTHSLAPDLAAQLRLALAGFANTPASGSGPTSDGLTNRSS